MHWSMQYAFAQIHEALQGLYANMNVPVLGMLLRGPIGWWGRMNPIGTMPKDRLGSHVARALQTPGETRDRLTEGIHVPTTADEHIAVLERALLLHHDAEAVVQKIKAAVKAKKLPKERPARLVSLALKADLITAEEADLLERAEHARTEAITVDSFELQDYLQSADQSTKDHAKQPN
jgi:acyl-CoA dehydrogenase